MERLGLRLRLELETLNVMKRVNEGVEGKKARIVSKNWLGMKAKRTNEVRGERRVNTNRGQR